MTATRRVALTLVLAGALAAWAAGPATAQTGAPTAAAAAPGSGGTASPAPAPETALDDLEPQPTLPDFRLINLSTPLRLPAGSMAFRVTHRFARPLNQGSFSDSLSDLFGLDSGAQIGLELRFAPVRGGQIGIYRTSDKTIQFFAGYNLMQQRAGAPLSASLEAGLEGTNNFKDEFSPSLALVLARSVGSSAAIHLVPAFVGNTNAATDGLADSDGTFVVGLGVRARVRRGLYLSAETSPRVSGFKGSYTQGPQANLRGRTLTAFAVEAQVGGHMFQINVSNALATTPANIARGAAPGETHWYLGFNIVRKFY